MTLLYALASSMALGSSGDTMGVVEGLSLIVLARSVVEMGPMTTSQEESFSDVTGMFPPTTS